MPGRQPLPSLGSQLRRLGLLLLLAVVVTLVGAFIAHQIRPSALLPIGSAPPAISLAADDGSTHTLPAEAGGSPYVVEFFEAGCSHCQEEAPRLCSLSSSRPGVHFYAIDSALENAERLRQFRHDHLAGCTSTSFPLLLDPGVGATHAWAVTAVPTVYLVDGGRIAYSGQGISGVDGLSAAIDRLPR